MNKEERDRRKKIRRDLQNEERGQAMAALPAPLTILQGLFDWLDAGLETGCDSTLRLTLEYCRNNALDEQQVTEWAAEYGGYCDCEVLANVEASNPAFD